MIFRKLLLAACVVGFLSPASSLADDNEITCFLPFWVGFGPTFLAEDLGYYAEEGLKVNIQFNDDRAVMMAAMEQGDVD